MKSIKSIEQISGITKITKHLQQKINGGNNGCAPTYCFHGGTCVEHPSSVHNIIYCKCPVGYEGARCELAAPSL